MKSLTKLWMESAADVADWCSTPYLRDCQTVAERVEHEGLSFLTITLPQFAADFERSLEAGRIANNLFLSFRRRGGLPVFLSGFLSQVFDARTGVLLEDPSPVAVRAVRQLCLLCKKVEMDCSPERLEKALEGYVRCEEDLANVLESYEELPVGEFSRVASMLFGDIFDRINCEVDTFALSPAHGPGATADKLVGNQKFVQSQWTERLEEYFPYGEYVLPHWKYFSECEPEFLSLAQERPVKVVFVPKTLKTPRVIAIEPTCMQYMQQALMARFVELIERDPLAHHFTHFTDQQLNRDAARIGSLTGALATLDLSEASDRVLNQLVIDMLRPWPSLLGAVQACRTTTAKLPNGHTMPLVKFASMGSALCFPFEAMVFTTIVFLGLQTHSEKKLTRSSLKSYAGRVHVYGDDIVVPADSTFDVVSSLEAFGLKINRTKSFSNGKFRESCGGDYFDGVWVTPIRIKQLPPATRRDVTEVVSWTRFMNASYEAGMYRAGDHAREVVERALSQRLQDVPSDSGAIGVHRDPRLLAAGRVNPSTQVPEVQGLRVVHKPRDASVSGVWALRKVFTGDWSDPTNEDHLLHSGRPLSSSIVRAWVPLFP